MRIAHINVVAGMSTGRIAVELCRLAMGEGHRTLLCHARDFAPPDVPSYRVGSVLKASAGKPLRVGGLTGVKLRTAAHIAWARIADRAGFMSRIDTLRLVRQLKAFKPDMLHLHNLHGYYLHLPTLFHYIKRSNLPVVWTLHDCWAFTGHCAYYTMARNAPPLEGDRRRSRVRLGCDRFTGGCGRCPLKRAYPASLLISQSARNWREKRELFTGIKYMVLATPSEWLRNEVKRSFLGGYPVYTLPNGIDLAAFKPCEDQRYMLDVIVHSRLKELGSRHLVLSVASVWEPRKGLEDLIDLSEALGEDYLVVAVGVDEYQQKALPSATMLGLPRTGNVNDLCALYTAAELYVSASHEETMGMSLVEAMACGTQVLCYDATAMPELVTPDVGEAVPLGDIEAMADAVRRLCAAPKSAAACRRRAADFDAKKRFAAYMRLYENMYRHCPAYERDILEARERLTEAERLAGARHDKGVTQGNVE